jgi:hypothetical protein
VSIEQFDLQTAVNNSGFPFQQGIQQLVNHSITGWRVELKGHPWTDPQFGEGRFIDIVASNSGNLVHLVIECKRARDADWIFLRESVSNEFSNNHLSVEARVFGKASTGASFSRLGRTQKLCARFFQHIVSLRAAGFSNDAKLS